VRRRCQTGSRLDGGRVDRPGATPPEGGDVGVDGHTVERDRPLDRFGCHGDRPDLHRGAEHHDVGRRRRPEQPSARPAASRYRLSAGPADLADPLLEQRRRRCGEVGVHHHLTGRHGAGRRHDDGPVRSSAVEVGVAGADQQVEGQQAVDAVDVGVVRRRDVTGRHPHVADHRPGLLRQPRLVQSPDVASVEHRRGAEDLADRDDARPPDSREPDREVVEVDDRWGRIGERVGRVRPLSGDGGGTGRGDRGERGAVALMHEKSKLQLVWWMRVLRPYGRVDRLHRQAVALVAAVAAALAHPLVDHHPEAGRGRRPRRRSRRFSAAHAWSWIITVTPGVAASSAWASSSIAGHTSTPAGSVLPVALWVVGGDDHLG
jgi:hypothetical protein